MTKRILLQVADTSINFFNYFHCSIMGFCMSCKSPFEEMEKCTAVIRQLKKNKIVNLVKKVKAFV
jgi:hypothetical protein